jgi:hypothetical protein
LVPDLINDHFNQYGKYPHQTVAIHNLTKEDEFFDADEFVVIEDVVDDVLDMLYPDSNN